jgi:hypothetical protein
MKSSTTRKTKKTETPRLMTRAEMEAITVRVSLSRNGWVVRNNQGVSSIHRTQAEAIEKARAVAKRLSGQLAIYDRRDHVRKWEVYWSGPIVLKRKPIPPDFRPVNATRKQMREAMKAVMRRRLALEVQQTQ